MTAPVIWLASYPKSGNTWLRLALDSLLGGGNAVNINAPQPFFFGIAAQRLYFDTYLHIDSSELTTDEADQLRPHHYRALAKIGTNPTLVKVHDAWRRTVSGEKLFPPEITRGVILILRDPRDVAVSLSYHLGHDLDQTITRLCNPNQTLAIGGETLSRQLPQFVGSWSSHAASWLDESDLPVLPIHYEAMLADPAKILRRIAEQFDVPASEKAIAGAVAATRFETLQAQEQTHGFHERPLHMKKFFRAGRAGAWPEQLTLDQIRRIEDAHEAMMSRLGYRRHELP